jgi:hypothetical protein
MAESPQIESVEQGDEYYHVRYRDPDTFEDIRTLDWAAHAASSVCDGAEVRTGDEEGDDEWTVQSVLVPSDQVEDEDDARDVADDVVDAINS